ncbi:MAG: hypothetical protein GY703_04530 [Gammaproteobacteria bacterium]|nr:hypothetical protein [Gammaproteobacteria bacterium]
MFECPDSSSFVARTEGDGVWLFLPGQTVQLPRSRSGSGSRYTDGTITFWSKGEEAMLQTAEISRQNCINNRRRAIWEHAKLNGVDFRAVGNEPGWFLEIRDQESILFVTDYGESEYLFEKPQRPPDSESGQTIYRVLLPDRQLNVLLKGETCRDSMADETYETRVLVQLDETTYMGCGRALH